MYRSSNWDISSTAYYAAIENMVSAALHHIREYMMSMLLKDVLLYVRVIVPGLTVKYNVSSSDHFKIINVKQVFKVMPYRNNQ